MQSSRVMAWFAAFFLGVLVALPSASAQSGDHGRLLNDAEKNAVRAGQVGIITGNPGGTYVQLARDMAVLLDTRGPPAAGGRGSAPIRVVPIVGRGSACNIEDLINLRGVDAAIVQHDVLSAMGRNPRYANIANVIGYVTTLYQEEIHLLARDGMRQLSDLRGKRLAVGEACSGSELTGANIVALAGLDVTLVTMPNERAVRALLRGDIDAILAVGGRPLRFLRDISPTDVAQHGLGLVDLAAQGALLDGYQTARLEARDYPALIPAGSVTTRAVTAMLAVYDWPRQNPRFAPTAAFVRALFDNLDRLRDSASGFSEKWREVDPRRELAGWRRFDAGPAPVPASDACLEAFHGELRQRGIEPAVMTITTYLEERDRFRLRSYSPCR